MKEENSPASTTVLTRRAAQALEDARAWLAKERRQGTVLAEESLWREAYTAFSRVAPSSDDHPRAIWACMASELVFDSPGTPLNQRAAGREACRSLVEEPQSDRLQHARKLQQIADEHDVEAWKLLALLQPGGGYPWMLPRRLWSREIVARNVEALLAPFNWKPGLEPRYEWLIRDALQLAASDFLKRLQSLSEPASREHKILGATGSLVEKMLQEGKDPSVSEPHSFVGALAAHGLSHEDVSRWHSQLLMLREIVVLLDSFRLYGQAETFVSTAEGLRSSDPEAALRLLTKSANIYKRLCVAQMYPEPLLERHQRIGRLIEEVRREAGMPDDRFPHVLLVSTSNSSGDLQRLLFSVGEEVKAFAYGKPVHVIVSDESLGEARRETEKIVREVRKSGLSVSHWTLEARDIFLRQLNQDIFPEGRFDVRRLAGVRRPGEKGVPYGRFRNFLRLAALHEIREHDFGDPIFTWLDQDNELGALVLTRAGTLSKRHVFNYFEQKSSIFDDPQILVGGGGYTNDALEGVERFWVAWGILHNALGLLQNHSPHGPSVLPARADITRFRPWDQPETLERLPREGEDVETMSDQVILLLKTLLGTFRGKYDNQVQIYHPWTYGYVRPDDECLVEEIRPFAGMPGGNTTFRSEILACPLPFITVGGRGEDIFHLWQIEGRHGSGSVCLTHSPVLHTRNVRAGRGDLVTEIIDSFNGRIFREPPYLWEALSLFSKHGDPERAKPVTAVEAETAARIDALWAEAKSSIGAVSSFAAELEPHLDANDSMWAGSEAKKNGPACAALIAEAGRVVRQFKDVARHHDAAAEKLLGIEEVKELTAEFLQALPHWRTVVEHTGGLPGPQASEHISTLPASGPSEGYGASLREHSESRPSFAGLSSGPDLPVFADPAQEPAWRDVITSSLLIFRRFERGLTEADRLLEWPQRLSRLKSIYDHYASHHEEIPASAWTELFRDALLIPYSAPYLAVSEMMAESFLLLSPGDRDQAADQLAKRFGVEKQLLTEAQPEATT